MQENNSQIIIYQTESGETKLDVRFQDETVWLTQKLMAELFQTSSQNITMHLKNIFEEGELEEEATCKDFLIVQKENTIKLFEQKQVRTHWHDEEEKWYFSVQDIVEILSESKDVKQYVKRMRSRDTELSSNWGTICTPLQC